MGETRVDIKEYEALKAKNADQAESILQLQMELAAIKKLVFGSKTERYVSKSVDPAQGTLFEVAQSKTELNQENQSKEKKRKTIRGKSEGKKKKKGTGFPSHLKRVVEYIEPEGLDLEQMQLIGEDVTEILAYVEAHFYVKKLVRPRYAKKDGQGVLQANIPERLIPKGKLDESVIAQLMVEKIYLHMPIYRFAKKMKMLDCDALALSTLQNGFHRATEALMPLYDLLVKEIQQSDYLQADESPIKVLTQAGKKKKSKGYMWVYRCPITGAVVFSYDPTRSKANPDVFLHNFKGYLQTDGYKVYEKYDKRSDIILLNCMAHARRKFDEALIYDEQRASHILKEIQKLYAIERKAKEDKFTHEQRLALRQAQAIPILDGMKQWLVEQLHQVPPKSAIGKAIAYSLERFKRLRIYTTDGRLEIDNNLVENVIRPLALGRKNYLFAHNEHTAQNLALLYSLIGTCQVKGINPRKYITWLLKKVVTHKITPDARQWLPHHINPSILE